MNTENRICLTDADTEKITIAFHNKLWNDDFISGTKQLKIGFFIVEVVEDYTHDYTVKLLKRHEENLKSVYKEFEAKYTTKYDMPCISYFDLVHNTIKQFIKMAVYRTNIDKVFEALKKENIEVIL